MIKWMNINQGFAMIMLTFIYVISTIVIVYYNHKSIKEMEKTRESESRPYIFVYLHKDPEIYVFIYVLKTMVKLVLKLKI